MEPLEVDDINFYPCKCEYQICRFCWHRIRTDENGLCPACRQPYPEDPVNFKPLSASDVQKIRTEKRQKQLQQRLKIYESRKHLSSYRVLQKNLVYVIGLSARVADPETLKKPEYFGKYGRILKVVVGSSSSTNGPQSASCTAYVTYARFEDALKAIQAVNNVQLDGRTVKASLGTTKYCTNFLRSQPCHKAECMYLHNVADTEVSFTKDDMHLGRHAEYEKKLIESTLREKLQRNNQLSAVKLRKRQSKSGSIERKNSSNAVAPVERNPAEKNDESSVPLLVETGEHQVNERPVMEQSNHGVHVNGSVEIENINNVKNIMVNNVESNVWRGTSNSFKVDIDVKDPSKEINCVDYLNEVAKRETLDKCEESSVDYTRCRSRLSEWISADSISMPANAGTLEKIEKMLTNSNGKDNISASNAGSSALNVSQAANITPAYEWQRTQGLPTTVNGMNDRNTERNDSHVAKPKPDIKAVSRTPKLSIPSDDDLGFDPFSESSKALADLIEAEKTIMKKNSSKHRSNGVSHGSSSLRSHGMRGWPSMGVVNGTSSPSKNSVMPDANSNTNNYSFMHSDFCNQSHKFSPAGHAYSQHMSMCSNQYSPHSYNGVIKPPMAQVNSFSSSQNMQPFQHAPNCNSFNTPSQYMSNSNQPSAASIDGSQLHEWQEGFRALLPNVNVRFVPDLNSAVFQSSGVQAMEPPHTNHIRPANSYESGLGFSGPMAGQAPPTMNAFTHPSQQWMMPPPGFSFVPKR